MSNRNITENQLLNRKFKTPGWSRPTDWLTLPTVTASEQKVVGLYAVFPNAEDQNYIAVNCAGNYTVNWGDGVTENFSTGVTATHQYDYTDADLNGTECSRGYKQAIVTITPNGGNLTSVSFNVKYSASLPTGYASNWLDIIVSSPNLTSLVVGSSSLSVSPVFLESFILLSKAAGLTSFNTLFMYCNALQYVRIDSSAGVTNFTNMFANCTNLINAPMLSTSSATGMASMFSNCYALEHVPLYSTSLVTTMASMFSGCTSLKTVPFFNTVSCTNFSSMFYNCGSLESVPTFNTVAGTNFTYMFQLCISLKEVTLNLTAATGSFTSVFHSCFSLENFYVSAQPGANALTTCLQTFYNCNNLKHMDLFNTGGVTNMSYMFSGRLETIPAFNLSSATTISNMINCNNLKEIPAFTISTNTGSVAYTSAFTAYNVSKFLPVGLAQTFSIANMKLSATELNNVYTNLATVTGKTITVTGNYGTTSDDPTIATAKGWTVTG